MPLRRLMTKGLYNARDLGGFPTVEGYVTRYGVFVRSEAPCELPEGDIDYLRNYGVTASMDFRSTGETVARPSDLVKVMPYYHKPLFNEAAVVDADRKRKMPKPGSISWGQQYISMAEESRQWAIDVLNIAAGNEGALLYHCTTGKDRTGLMSCYLLSIAGVAPADIIADYCVSQVYLEPVYARMRSGMMNLGDKDGKAPPMDDSFFRTLPESMKTLIDYLTENYGGVVAYLHKIGVQEDTIEKLRARFLENA